MTAYVPHTALQDLFSIFLKSYCDASAFAHSAAGSQFSYADRKHFQTLTFSVFRIFDTFIVFLQTLVTSLQKVSAFFRDFPGNFQPAVPLSVSVDSKQC